MKDWTPTPFEIAVATARLEYGVSLAKHDRRVLEWAAARLRDSLELVSDETTPVHGGIENVPR